MTLNWLGSSLAVFTCVWCFTSKYGAHLGWGAFPIDFCSMLVSSDVLFLEEAVEEVVLLRGTSARAESKGSSWPTQADWTDEHRGLCYR
jgi:hypothetical protein